MLRLPLAEDRKKLTKGLLIMLVGVMTGIIVVDMQLNSLTRQHEFVQIINLRRDPIDGYSAYLFGNSYPIGAVTPIALMQNTNREFIINAGDFSLRLPTKVNMDTTNVFYWLRLWSRQFVEEGYRTKTVLNQYGRQLYQKMTEYMERALDLLQGGSSR